MNYSQTIARKHFVPICLFVNSLALCVLVVASGVFRCFVPWQMGMVSPVAIIQILTRCSGGVFLCQLMFILAGGLLAFKRQVSITVFLWYVFLYGLYVFTVVALVSIAITFVFVQKEML